MHFATGVTKEILDSAEDIGSKMEAEAAKCLCVCVCVCVCACACACGCL